MNTVPYIKARYFKVKLSFLLSKEKAIEYFLQFYPTHDIPGMSARNSSMASHLFLKCLQGVNYWLGLVIYVAGSSNLSVDLQTQPSFW